MAKKILFIRHGESESNAGEKTEHPQSINLTALGREQARDKAAGLTVTPDLIVTSSYIRTKQTAEPFVEKFPNIPAEEWNLHEFTFLAAEKYRNTTNDERRPDLMAFWTKADPDHRDGEGAESFNEFVDRCRVAIRTMKDAPGDTVLVFCHGYVMNCIRYILEEKFDAGVTPEGMLAFWDYHAMNKIDNCETLEFNVDGGKVSLAQKPSAPPPPVNSATKKPPGRILD